MTLSRWMGGFIFLYDAFGSSSSRMPLHAQLRASLLIALLYFASRTISAQSSPDTANSSMQRDFQAAMAAEDRGDLDRAQAVLSALRTHHPGIFEIDESLGLLYAKREDYTHALPALQSAVREQPSSDVAHANLGAVYSKLNRSSEALIEFQAAARLNPGNVETQQSLGQLWMDAHKLERAEEAFCAAMRLRPDDSDLLLTCAQALNDAGQTDQASQTIAKLAGVDQSAPAQSLWGDIAEKQGAFQQAAQHYARAAEIDPSEANAWALGVEFLRHWTFDAAIREFEAAVARFPPSIRMRLGLGAAYFGNGNYDKAIPVFADLLDTDSNNGLYAEMLGLSCNAVMQQAKPRCSSLMAYAQSHPQDAKVSTYAAATFLARPVTDEERNTARKLLESAMAADPKLADAAYEMAVLKQNDSDWAGSIPDLERAVALKPDFARAHYRLSLAYLRSGRKQEGKAQMELQKKYAMQQEEDLDHRLRQITTFIVDVHN